MIDAANTHSHRVAYCPFSRWSSSGKVIIFSFAPTRTFAVKYYSQKPWKAKMVMVPTAGAERGSITRKKMSL